MCASLNVIMKYYLRKNLSDRILFGTHATACMQISTGQEKKTHTEFVLQCSIFNFLTVFGIKITKSSRIPKRKVNISSNLTGYSISLSWNYLQTLYSWKILRCEINVHEKMIYKIRNKSKYQLYKIIDIDHIFTAYKRPLWVIVIQGHLGVQKVHQSK